MKSVYSKYILTSFPPVNFLLGPIFVYALFLHFSKITTLPSLNSYHIIIAISFVLFGLLLRCFDDLKDYEDDLKNFPDRAIPSGLISVKQVQKLSLIIFSIIALINILNPFGFYMAITVLCFSLLFWQWFFLKKHLHKNLVLAFLTHHPVVFLQIIYLISSFGVPKESLSLYMYGLPFALLFTHWEVARKIKVPKQENNYTTYSMVLGYKNAICTLAILQIIITALSWSYLVQISAGAQITYAYLVTSLLAFVFTLSHLFVQRKTPFKAFAEIYMTLFIFATIALGHL